MRRYRDTHRASKQDSIQRRHHVSFLRIILSVLVRIRTLVKWQYEAHFHAHFCSPYCNY